MRLHDARSRGKGGKALTPNAYAGPLFLNVLSRINLFWG